MGADISLPPDLQPRQFLSTEIPKCGVRLSFFAEFIEKCGGRDSLVGKTTSDVCFEYVKKITEPYRCSLCNLLEAMNHDAFREPAEVLISHAWSYKFLDMVDILMEHFKDRPDIVIWFDLFSNNQHQAADMEYDWWATTFRNLNRDIGYTLMVLAPWNDPVILKRAWCWFDLYCTCDCQCRFEVALGRKGRDEFIVALRSRNAAVVFKEMLANIDVSKSNAFKVEDKERILDTFRRTVGLSHLNGMVLSLMRDWVLEVAKAEYEKRFVEDGLNENTLRSMHNLAELYTCQGNYATAESLYQECLEEQRSSLGDSHHDTLRSMICLADLYCSKQGKYTEAEALYNDCLQKQKALSDDHTADILLTLQTLQTMNNLAILYTKVGKCFEAQLLLQECVEKRRDLLGETHPDTVTLNASLASLYCCQGRYDEAEPIYMDCLEKQRAVLSDTHPDTLTTISNLAKLYDSQGRYAEAEPLYADCLEKRRAVLGASHPDTQETINRLAELQQLLCGSRGK